MKKLIIFTIFCIAAWGQAEKKTSKTEPKASTKVEAAVPAGVTMANFSRIKTGMTYPQVVKLLGKEGQEMSSNEIAGHTTVMYMWQSSGLGNMNAMFQDGKLISKSQFGLK